MAKALRSYEYSEYNKRKKCCKQSNGLSKFIVYRDIPVCSICFIFHNLGSILLSMKRFLCILFFFFSFASYSQSSNYWLQAAGSPTVDENLGIAKDNANNVITVGYFTNTITFPNNTKLTSASSGVTDVLIQKTDPLGQLIWAFKAGGAGSDRATAVACDGSGNIYITGYYYGSAQFGSFTLNSVNNTQDIFIAKLNSSGTFLWAKSAGGNLGEEPYAIDVDAQGNVIITGEFQGTATFGTQALTSMVNNSGAPSFDIFIAKYDNAGNFLWVRQGSAQYDDRGLDVGTDANGNIFVCGQFSDTVMFNQIHNNQIMNAIFIIKYSPSGQELWFVKAGASSSIAYGLAVDNNNDIYITGDYTGNLIFYGTPNNFLFGSFSNRIFLVKYNNNGTYLWGKEDASNSYVSSKDVALNANQEPCIYGEFDCRMDEYSIMAGGTGMFNSVGFHDLFITQYDKNGNRLWGRNFGGAYNDKSHGLVFTNNLTPYVCGSFGYMLFVNSIYNPFNVLTRTSIGDGWISSSNCDNDYGYYYGTKSAGFSDCFIMHGVDSTCAYYDYYFRSGAGCYKDFVGGCIDNGAYNCQDTLNLCGPNYILANPYSGTIGGVGPFYRYQWNTSDTMQHHYVTASSNYSCIMTTIDGCFTSEDTVYARVFPIPQPPTITDNFSININQPPQTNQIVVCDSTVTLTGGNLQGCTYQWSGPGIVSTSDSSCVVNQTGLYVFTLTDANGCSNINQVFVKFDKIDHVKPKTNMPDTLQTCEGLCVSYFIYDSISNPTAQQYSCFTSLADVITDSSFIHGFPYCEGSNLKLSICPKSTGWVNLNIKYIFNSKCGKDSAYFQKQVYIIVNPNPVITSNNLICPGDSAFFTITPLTNISYSLTLNTADPVWAIQHGGYGVTVYAIDTMTGCHNRIDVHTKPNPFVSTTPANGLICPGDSVKITCVYTGAVSWQWHGPSGIIPINASSIYDSVPGFYYCVATDNEGCILTSNTVEIKKYNTPYLVALPQTVVCAGQKITLQVMSNDTSLIQWMAPLSGSGTIRTVTQSGTYQCKVTVCGITTSCSITVTVFNPVAHITAHGPTVMCPGDSVLLTANSGMASYLWLPTNQMNDSIYAYASETYVVIATDDNGCQAKDSISVSYSPNAPPRPTTTNDSICKGSVAHLQASTTGNYSIEWYAQQYSGFVVNAGTGYTTPSLNQNTRYFVSVKDSVGCHSLRQPANVFIKLTSLMPPIEGDSLLCAIGDTLNLNTTVFVGATYNWTGPNNFTSSIVNPQIPSADISALGTYSLVITGSGCNSPVATHTITLLNLRTPSIIGALTICQGSSLVLQGYSLDSNVIYSWTGPNNFSYSGQTSIINSVDSLHAGTYYLQTNYGQCESSFDSLHINIISSPLVSLLSDTSICANLNDTLKIQTIPSYQTNILWNTPAGNYSNMNPLILTNLTSNNSGWYQTTVSSANGCKITDSIHVNIYDKPSIEIDTLCLEEQKILTVTSGYPFYIWNIGSDQNQINVDSLGVYSVTVKSDDGCITTDSINIYVVGCIYCNASGVFIPNVFTPNGDGNNDVLYVRGKGMLEFYFAVYNRWGEMVFETTDINKGWDGNYKGMPADPVVFDWYLRAKCNGKELEKKGNVTLVR